jgi:GTP diphosphokinase / guanosine-3',5'-bis(diphosphate) 3'-diphosphatase
LKRNYIYLIYRFEMDPTALLAKARQYLPEDKIPLVESAYAFAARAHEGQVRKSGDPYLEHPLATALILADLQLDAASLAAALLHDVPEDTKYSNEDIRAKFGPEVARLVAGVTKLNKITWQKADESKEKSQAENLRKMLIAMAEDLRVVFIKLADRLHNMRTLSPLSAEKRYSISRETLDIYAPLAHRLGIWEVKWQLEDLAFRYLDAKQYHDIAKLVTGRRAQREEYVSQAVKRLKDELEKAEIKAEVFGRPKHIYSIFNKMKRYAEMGKNFGDIHDLFAVRVLVNTVQDCYKTLGVIHSLWHPLPEEFNDYIANPKENGYQSLHTTVLSQGTTPLEIQIRTYDMHRIADYGVAAHWRYKEDTREDKAFDDKLTWLRQLIEWQGDLDSEQFLESLKTDVFIDQVFVYTPRGEIKALPRGATPLDFAYRIHTDLGHRCIGAKVNGKLVPLNRELKNGDIVEVMSTKSEKGPSLDWLNTDLGYVKTSHALEKIRQFFKKQERTENVEHGKQILDREIKRLGIGMPRSEDLLGLFEYNDYEELLAAIGYGGITPHQLNNKLAGETEQVETPTVAASPKKVSASGIEVLGVGDLLTRLASCCHPLPGDDIVGFITRSKGVSIHRKDCPNMVNLVERERLINVNWGLISEVYSVDVQVNAWNRVGLLKDVSTMVAEDKINISNINLTESVDQVALFITLDVRDMNQLNHILGKICSIRGVNTAERIISQNKAGVKPLESAK